MRSVGEWRAHPAGQALESLPLLDFWTSGGTADRSARRGPSRAPVAGAAADGLVGHRPAAGLRVLDLTRVIAGPVGTRTLSALGAQVLRIDPPHLPEIAAAHQDTGPGKRSALVDLRTPVGRAVVHDLLSSADVLVHGYRPGALEALGLDQTAIVRRYPHLVTVSLSAWGHEGPWARRRGFDSVVQSASGIAAICGDDGRPGVLPAQLLDHATGHLAAAAALRGLTERATTGRPGHARLALARTAAWLLSAPRVPPSARGGALEGEGSAYLVELDSPAGRITHVAPPGALGGTALAWTHGAHPWGTDLAVWPA
jgi:crotonobetainyl-CoA:carnitine CoA-transferase CaiB-like acyl-CoA transferase